MCKIKFEKIITPFIGLMLLLLISTAVVSASDWPQFQQDCQNTGLTTGSAIRERPEILWSKCVSGNKDNGINVPPIIAGNLVYVYTTNGSLLAFDKNNGCLAWESPTTKGNVLQSSTPAYGNGKIFIASNDGDLFAFDAITGKRLWHEHVTDSNFECPITYYDHMLYIGEGLKGGVTAKHYYCYSEDGNQLWKYAIEDSAGFPWSGACISGDFIVYSTHEGKIISLDRKTGKLADELNLRGSGSDPDIPFSKEEPGMFRSSITYYEGYLYTSSERGQDTGYVWKVGFDANSGEFVNDGWCIHNGFSTSTPVVYEGKVYVGQGEHGYTGNLTCLDASEGKVLWSYFTDAGIKSSSALSVENGKPYIYFTGAENDGSLYCLKEDGTLAWEYNPPDDGYILQGAAISDGKVYFGTGSGHLYCLQEKVPEEWYQFHKDVRNTGFSPSDAPETPNILWESEDIGAVSGSSPIIAEGKVFVNCGDYVKSLDFETGEFLANHSNVSTKYNSIASPSYHNGNIYCGMPESVNSGTTVADGKMFKGEWDGKYYCFDENTGNEIWRFTTTGNAQATPAYDDGKVYFTSWEYGKKYAGHVYCVDAESGEEVWHQEELEQNCCSSPTIYDDRVYVTTFNFYGDGELYALDRNNGSILWKRTIQRTDSTPAVAYGNVYVAGGCYGYSDLQTYCFDASTGNLIWNTSPADRIGGWTCSAAVADGKVFVGTAPKLDEADTGLRGIYALDAYTGELIWNGSKGGSSPAISDGILFTVADGKVYAYRDTAIEEEMDDKESPGFNLVLVSIVLLISTLLTRLKK